MATETPRAPRDSASPIRVVRAVGIALILLGILKYLVILAEEDFELARAPHFFLILLIPIAVGLFLSRTKAGRVVLGIMFVLFVVIAVNAMIMRGFAQQNWSDALVVFVGGPLALLGVIMAARSFRSG